ncbi:MAG: hypothetical protein IPK82_31730 [Polyangiaceae bacterium]|nr:hypothetical protein [Polyangiaceae bacterium]
MASSNGSVDRVLLLVACRRLEEAETLAKERLAQTLAADPVDRLAAARATKTLADVQLELDNHAEATRQTFEARRRYRPFRNSPTLSAEVDLTLAQFAVHDDRSLEGEQILADATERVQNLPGAELEYAKLVRYAAHLQITRGEFKKGDALVGEAVAAVQRAVHAERASGKGVSSNTLLLLSQYLFTQGESAFMVEDVDRARNATRAALDLTETELHTMPEYVQFCRARAENADRIFNDPERLRILQMKEES